MHSFKFKHPYKKESQNVPYSKICFFKVLCIHDVYSSKIYTCTMQRYTGWNKNNGQIQWNKLLHKTVPLFLFHPVHTIICRKKVTSSFILHFAILRKSHTDVWRIRNQVYNPKYSIVLFCINSLFGASSTRSIQSSSILLANWQF